MPRTNRTPPSGGVMRSNSKSDATGNPTPQSPDNIAQRSKRPRAECSPASDLSQFREEIKNMLAEWKSDQDNVLTKLVSELSDLKAQNVKIQKSYLEIEKSIEFMSSKYEEFFKQIIEFEKERKELKDYILNLETKIQDLQNKSRPSVLEIRNVPKKDDETLQDLINVVCKVGKTVKMDISPTELRDIYRAPGKPDTNSAIIADFTSVITKSQYLSNVRQYNKERAPSEKLTSGQVGLPGKSAPIYVDEHLPNSMKKLFYLVRTFAKQNNYRFCWTTNGRIFLRKEIGSKAINITSEKCLRNLEQSTTYTKQT